MNRFSAILLTGLLAGSAATAQTKKLTLEQAVRSYSGEAAIQSLKSASWNHGAEAFSYITQVGGKDAFVLLYPQSGRRDTVSLSTLNNRWFGGDTLRGLPPVQRLKDGRSWFQRGSAIYFTNDWSDVKAGRATAQQLDAVAENVTVDESTGNIAYTVGNNLFLQMAGGKAVPVSSDTDEAIVNGQTVHRSEFGITGGIFFSPAGNLLAYYHMDQRPVKDYPVIDWKPVPAVNKNIKYPMAGDSSHIVTLRVFNPQTGSTVTLQTGLPAEQYLTSVTWAPDEKSIYVGLLNRDQNHLQLRQYDAQTGAQTAQLFEEKSTKYVEPQNQLAFIPGTKGEFLWWSQRQGFMHLYRYNSSGKLLNAVTQGDWLVNDILGFYAPGNEVLVSATKESALEKHSYAVNWKTGKMRRLDKAAGTHNAVANESGTRIWDNWSSNEVPRQIDLIEVKNGKTQTLVTGTDFYAAPTWSRARVENVTLRATDGTPLYGKIILPADLDSTKQYPSITYLYNGPHVQLVKNSFPASGNLWYEFMADKGYVVFVMDGRGSSNRGLAFEQAPFRQLGTVEMEDQLKGNEYLRGLKFIDTARMGVHGWSFGGFMTTSLMLRHPNAYKVGVAGGPVMNWEWYEIMYTERYMDRPQENPEGYAAAELPSKAGNLKGKLLLIHGTDDDVVVWQHSINFIRSCVEKNVQADYFVYPGHPHNVRGKDRIHLMQKITDYFDLYLK